MGEKRGNQSTASPWVMAWTFEPSVFITKRSWLPRRELDQTIIPFALPPAAPMACFSAALGCSSLPLAPPPVVAHAPSARASVAQAIPRTLRAVPLEDAFDESRGCVG